MMLQDPPESLISGFLEGELDEAQAADLSDWVTASRENARHLASLVTVERGLVKHSKMHSASSILAELPETSVWDEVVDQALAERRKHEIEAEANRRLAAQQAEDAKALRLRLAHAPTPDPVARVVVIPKVLVWLGAAAVLGLAALVVTHLNRSTPAPTQLPPIVENQPKRDVRTEPAPVLATLVRTLGARWADSADAWDGPLGLRQGQHHLSSGLVEIELTTGTRVVLEAPVSFGLTSKNAMTLRDGRLVAHVPPSGVGFTVDTPTSRVIDYGTEFGVYADGSNVTQVQVFRGEVRAAARVDGAVVGEAVPLFVEEAATVAAESGAVERSAFEPVAFERRVAQRLDVLDIVAGGDGLGSRRGSGINPETGRRVESFTHPLVQPAVDPPRFRSVAGSPIIDGVFVAADAASLDSIDSGGHRPDFLPATDQRYLGPIWAMPMSEVGGGNEYTQWAGAIQTPELFSPRGLGLLVMHSNAGITFDLQTAARGSGLTATRFTAVAANAETQGGIAAPNAPEDTIACSVYVVVDGQVRFKREDFNSLDGVFDIDVPLREGDRYLTLIVSDGTGHYDYDWAVIGDPVIELSPSMVDGE